MIIEAQNFLKMIKEPIQKSVSFMREHESRIAMFSTGQGKEVLFSEYKRLFVAELSSTIDNEFEVHTKKLLAPNTGTVHSHFKKVYDSLEGRNNDFNFTDSKYYVDYLEYLRSCFLSGLDNISFSKEYLSSDILYNPNTRYYIDFQNAENNNQLPLNFELSKPVVKRVTCDLIHSVKENDSETEYIIFYEKKDKVITKYFLIDSEKYVVAELKGSNFEITNNVLHSFKKVPVTSASNSKMYTKESFEIKKSVISDSLDDLRDWLLIKNQAKIYFYRNQTPMHFELGSSCNNTSDNGSLCAGGYLQIDNKDFDANAKYGMESKEYLSVACPACQRKKQRKMLFGKNVEVNERDFFNNPKEISNLKDMYGFVTTDVNMLRFSEEKLKTDLENIEKSIIGHTNVTTKEAINEKQVSQNGESKAQTLTSFAENIENKEMFLYNCLGYARYENDYQYSDVFLGRTYTFNDSNLVEDLQKLNDSKASLMLRNRKQNEIIKLSYGYDKDLVQIVEIINAVIPFQDLTILELIQNKLAFNETDYNFRLYSDKLIAYLNNELKQDSNLLLLPFEQQIDFVTKQFKEFLTKNIIQNGETESNANGINNGVE